jgi:hypothetical protein
VFFIAAWVAMYGLWLLFVDAVAPSELIAGVPAAAIAATALEVLRRQGLITFRPRARWMGSVARLPRRVAGDFGLVMGALIRHLLGRGVQSRFRAFPFPARDDDEASVSHQAWVTATGSIAPNMYVVGFDRRLNRILVHELVPQRPSRATTNAVEID